MEHQKSKSADCFTRISDAWGTVLSGTDTKDFVLFDSLVMALPVMSVGCHPWHTKPTDH